MAIKKYKQPPEWLKKGAYVNYHSPIGGPIMLANRRVQEEPSLIRSATRWQSDQWITFIEGKAGWVAIEALSLAQPAPDKN